jgi:flagellar basal body-associated protein FliL
MSEEAEKPPEHVLPKKGKVGLIIGIVIAVVTLVGGSVAGAVLGPKLLGGSSEEHEEEEEEEHKPAKSDKSHKSEKSDKHDKSEKGEGHGSEGGPEHIVTVDVPSVVVDILDNQGRIRHLKVGLTAELADKVPAEEFRLFIPRGREAALTYLRSLPFEQVADPNHFTAIKDELGKRVSEAVGEERVHRMMLTDFVIQ